MKIITQKTLKNNDRLAKSALAYATRFKWPVLPIHSITGGQCTCQKTDCSSQGKHPLTLNGVKDATIDAKIISEWWERWPNSNIGIAAGSEAGFFVLDVDGQAGAESLEELEQTKGKLPSSIEQITGSGGRHILFKFPCNMAIGNKVALAPGLDIRSNNGYIVAAPSIHISGRLYHWELSSRPGEVELAEAPGWLLAMLDKKEPQGMSRSGEEWRKIVIDGAEQGKRNATVAALAGYLLRRFVDPYVVLTLLRDWNSQRCKPPLADSEVLTITESIARKEAERRCK